MPLTPPFPLRHCLAMLLLSPSFVYAAQAVQLEQTTVSATRTEQNISSVPSTVSVLDTEQLDKNNVNTIKDLVRHEAGVSVGGTGHSSGISGYNIRGIDGNRILTQIDGVEIPDAYAFGPYANTRRNYVDPSIIKQVEILRGPASALYGSSAIGGAVSYFTLDPADIIKDGKDYGARLKAGYSSADDSWLSSATLAGQQGPFDALLHYSKRSGHETETQGDTGGLGATRSHANPEDNDSYNVLAKLGYHYGEAGSLKLAYEHFQSTIDGDIKSAPTAIFGFPTSAYRGRAIKDVIERERFSVENQLAIPMPFADNWLTRLSYQNASTDQRTYQPNSASSRYRKTTYQERSVGLDNQLDKAFALGDTEHLLTYGLSYKYSEISGLRTGSNTTLRASDFPDPTVESWGLYVQDQIRYGAWTILPALRYDYETLDPKGTVAYLSTASGANEVDLSEKRWHHVSPKLGITYDVNEQYSAYGQYAEGFRTPTAKALYGNFTNESAGYQVIGNSDLDPETSKGVEFGMRGNFEQGSFSLAAFYNRYRDFIEEDALGGAGSYLSFRSSNISKASIRGAEAKGRLELSAFGLPQGIYTQGSIAYARGKNEDTGAALNSVNPLTGTFGLGYEQDDQYGALLSWTLSKRKTRVDDSTYYAADGSNKFRTPGFGIVDLTGYYKVTRDITVNAGLYNLTDKKYWLWDDVRGYDSTGEAGFLAPANIDRLTQPGRNFSVNVVWDI